MEQIDSYTYNFKKNPNYKDYKNIIRIVIDSNTQENDDFYETFKRLEDCKLNAKLDFKKLDIIKKIQERNPKKASEEFRVNYTNKLGYFEKFDVKIIVNDVSKNKENYKENATYKCATKLKELGYEWDKNIEARVKILPYNKYKNKGTRIAINKELKQIKENKALKTKIEYLNKN